MFPPSPLSPSRPLTLGVASLVLAFAAPCLLTFADTSSSPSGGDGSVDPFAVIDAADGDKKKKTATKAAASKNRARSTGIPFPLPGREGQAAKAPAAETHGDGSVDPFAQLDATGESAKGSSPRKSSPTKKTSSSYTEVKNGAVDPFAVVDSSGPSKGTTTTQKSSPRKSRATTKVKGGAVDPFARLDTAEQKQKARKDRKLNTEPDPFGGSSESSRKKSKGREAAPPSQGDGAVDPFDVLGR